MHSKPHITGMGKIFCRKYCRKSYVLPKPLRCIYVGGLGKKIARTLIGYISGYIARHTHTQQHTQHKMSCCSPYPHRLCPPSPWKHPPWTQIDAPRLPMSPIEAPGGWAHVRCVWSLCLGRQNGAHQKIERRVEHLPLMAAI